MSAPQRGLPRHDQRHPQRTLRSRVAFATRRTLRPRRLLSIVLLLLLVFLVHDYLPDWESSAPYTPPPEELPPDREGEDWLDSVNPLYRALVPLQPPAPPFPLLRPTRMLPPACLERWFANGEMNCTPEDVGPEDKLDFTWLWVNGSDTRWNDEMVYWRQKQGVFSPEFHFRELNELIYSMRSVLGSMSGLVRNFHLILYDFAFDPSRDQDLIPPSTRKVLGLDTPLAAFDSLRVAQTPNWLNFSALNTSSDEPLPQLRYATHSELFHLPSGDRDGNVEYPKAHAAREKTWRDSALPTYSSKSIETRLGWLPGLSDAFVAMNDDFFMLRPHSVSDFYSTMFGSVIRFDPGFYQQVRPHLKRKTFDDAGETGGLYHANYWLSKRYRTQLRPYVAHGPKILSRSLHHEASLMFAEVLTKSSSRRFRELPYADGDVQIQWLLTALRVERWREALLWTYVVANIGAKQGCWDKYARQKLATLLGIRQQPGESANVHRGDRYTLEKSRINHAFQRAGWESPKVAKYIFSSLDGHLPRIIHPDRDQTVNDFCVMNMDDCFGTFWKDQTPVPSEEVFKRIAFQQPECGDCIIMALVTASGPLGLSAFFPPRKQTFRNNPTSKLEHTPTPHLPLTPTWQEANFSLQSVLATTAAPGRVNLRRYCMQLLSRYLYISAEVPAEFHMIRDVSQARESLRTVDRSPLAAALGLNDNIGEGFDSVKTKLNQWFEKKWPLPAPWERVPDVESIT